MTLAASFALICGAAVLTGYSCGLLGCLVVGLRLPFLAVCTAHAALAGAVLTSSLGVSAPLGALGGAFAAALAMGILLRRRDIDANGVMGSLFSLTLGLAFLGMGLNHGARTEALGLLWGSLLFVSARHLCALALVAVLVTALVFVCSPALKALLFSRPMAATLVPEALLFAMVLVLSAGVIAVALDIVGGLMVYSLVCNPALAASRLCRHYRTCLVCAAALGGLSAAGGFAAAYFWDLPVGAAIVLISSLLALASAAIPRNSPAVAADLPRRTTPEAP